MAGPTTSPRPKARPLAPAKSPRPASKPNAAEAGAVARGNRSSKYEAEDLAIRKLSQENKMKCGGKVSKMAVGGKVRGMGAAKKGGKFSKNG